MSGCNQNEEGVKRSRASLERTAPSFFLLLSALEQRSDLREHERALEELLFLDRDLVLWTSEGR